MTTGSPTSRSGVFCGNIPVARENIFASISDQRRRRFEIVLVALAMGIVILGSR
jgi:hypothetical protein